MLGTEVDTTKDTSSNPNYIYCKKTKMVAYFNSLNGVSTNSLSLQYWNRNWWQTSKLLFILKTLKLNKRYLQDSKNEDPKDKFIISENKMDVQTIGIKKNIIFYRIFNKVYRSGYGNDLINKNVKMFYNVRFWIQHLE